MSWPPGVDRRSVTGISTQVFRLTAPSDATVAPQLVGRLLYVMPASVQLLLLTTATVPPFGALRVGDVGDVEAQAERPGRFR